MDRCGIQHKHGGQTCIRQKGHDGLCRSRSEPGNGMLTYSEWESRDGEFYNHVGYTSIYPPNAMRGRYVTCPDCGREIPDSEWSCADEWDCECGASGEVDDSDEEE